ncbi:ROK family transcriptional regulator [Anaeromicropila herbilytica]|uniref:Transcriptional regulator n=1 Tax=Anaeromicropila herbilytica TaxID=2785025 RepID=A0A7R7IBF9_9FIRM|nr:ROK family transcriptional regulator [Anaeromicropila herbilytica]BCN29613.1 transcriptional regulator [Anaeromicropila herbilytica]
MGNMTVKGKNLKYLRETNTNEILKILATTGEASRIDLSKLIGLSKMTITNIVTMLMVHGYVKETRIKVHQDNSITGPKPMLLSIVNNKILAIGVHITSDVISFSLSDIKKGILSSDKIVVNKEDDKKVIEQKILSGIKNIIDKNWQYKSNIIGIGVASEGLVDSNVGVITRIPDLPNISNFSIKNILENAFSYPVYVNNDMQGAILAEQLYGHGRELKDFIYLGFGKGIGTAIVADGRIMTGSRGFATEAGHMSIDYNGKQCRCGNRGCLELYSSIPVLLEKSQSTSMEEMIDKYLNGDKLTNMVLMECMNFLDIAITNLVNIFDPECIIFGHEGALFPQSYISLLEDRINQHVIRRSNKKTEVKLSTFKTESALRGASAIVFFELFHGNIGLEFHDESYKEVITL